MNNQIMNKIKKIINDIKKIQIVNWNKVLNDHISKELEVVKQASNRNFTN